MICQLVGTHPLKACAVRMKTDEKPTLKHGYHTLRRTASSRSKGAAMFSPFRTANGKPKTLAEVTWDDLPQLADLDEGFALEFKRSYNASVQKKIPKIIASFANSRGGWLVVGIADDDKSVCPIPKPNADFGQIIGELCRRHVSPIPHFDARFICDPANPLQGVLVMQVAEGNFPPYIANGIVEVREGSTSGPAQSSALVELYGKATKRRGEIAGFCQRSVYYPTADRFPSPQGSATGVPRSANPTPLFDLYLYRMSRHAAEAPARADVNEHVAAMRKVFTDRGMGCHVQHAHDSRIIRASALAGALDVHSAIELFGDESIKLTVPAVLLDGRELERANMSLRAAGLAVDDENRLIDARDTLRRVTRMATVLDKYVRERGIAWQQYAVAYELENMAGVMLWSDSPLYLDYVAKRGALFCGTTDCRSRIRYLNDGEHESFRARQFAGSHFFEACGLPLGSDDDEDNALVDALLSTSPQATLKE